MYDNELAYPSRTGWRNDRPIPHAAVSAFPLDGDLVLCDERTGAVYVLNSTGALTWSLFDGTRTARDVARALSAAYGIGYRRALADVRVLTDGARQSGLLMVEA